MRPLELTLVLACLLTLALLLQQPVIHPALYAALLVAPLVLGLAQYSIEGYRWQILPLYLVAAAFGLIAIAQMLPSLRGVQLPRWAAWTSSTFSIGAVLIGAGLAWFMPVFHLPRPTGAFAVGTRSEVWIDPHRADRRIPVQWWYPAPSGSAGERAPYIDDPTAFSAPFGVPGFFFHYLGAVRTNALVGAPLAANAQAYPVLLFSHGATGTRSQNSFQFEELASQGYVVLSIDHTFRFAVFDLDPGLLASAEGTQRFFAQWEERVLPEHVADQRFAVDQLERLNSFDPLGMFTERLDLRQLGLFGHSAGAAAGAEFCRQDERCRAFLSLDGHVHSVVQRDGLTQPYLFFGQDSDPTMSDAQLRERGFSPQFRDLARDMLQGIDAAMLRTSSPTYRLRLTLSGHVAFTDQSLMVTVAVGPLKAMVGLLPAERAHHVINAYTLAFFDRHLRGQTAPLLDGPAPAYPEVQWIATPEVR
ncbi:hypothetical protein SD80_012095 [Scytonema tolypothrichoides VB-61278]|nr:hypothetical protein SD80_012095 [Scytonema tolypothrichoides VB-61278]